MRNVINDRPFAGRDLVLVVSSNVKQKVVNHKLF